MDWKGAGEALGTVAVIGSLIFVALEVRQNTNAVRSSLIQAISEQSYAATVLAIENADLRAAGLAESNGEDLTDDQRSLLSTYFAAAMRIQQNRFLQAQLGILDEDILLQLGGRGGFYRRPIFAEIWAESKDTYAEDFQEFVERELLPLSQNTVSPRP